ncbi:MAG: ferrous iron transporter B [Bacillota bacterium]|jgi:ferrous iron transport protein B|nr:ferrous iron transporter B [Bacillota bacterium]NLL26193.1 ferrous iron transporter B [Erysipelotrichia bacterium]
MRIALTGNPNSGKTTMYNALTGRYEKVGNWAGVTLEKKEYPIKKVYASDEQLIAVDLPGAYSMSPFTSEESITSSYVRRENPDVIINIVEATNLSRSLFFTTQLLELGIPVVVALNKSDLSEKKGTKINVEKLSNRLGCPVINTVSTTGEGLKEVVEAAISVVGSTQKKPYSQGEVDLNDKSAVEAADRKRFDFVNKIVEEVETRKILTKDKNFGDKIDAVLTNKWLGIPIFVIVMFLVFYISQAEGPLGLGKYLEGVLTGAIDSFQGYVADLMVNTSPLLQSIVVEGIIGGISAVLGFLPLVMVMYFLIALLEDCGYMARVAVVLDPIFKKVGLSGKSVIPFVISIGCAVPGIMACRTIRNERERRVTAMLAPFMPCGAKIPVIGLFAGAFFDNASWVSTLVYFTGIALIFLGALLVNKIVGHKARKSFFIIELPEYKIPSLWGAFKTMMSRGWAYIVKAATIIMLCNLAVHLMQTFTWSFTVAESADQSILASIASPFAYLLVPIVGVLSWQLAAAAVTGLIAKENVVGTLAVCFVGLENLIDVEEFALLEGAGAEVAGIIAITKIAALAYLMFNLYTPPCFAAIGSMNSEMKSAKWLWGGIALQLGVGYTVAYFVYTIGTIITGATLNVAAAVGGFMAVLVMVAIVAGLILNTNKKLKSEYELSNVNN